MSEEQEQKTERICLGKVRFFLGGGGEGWGLRREGHQWKWAPKGEGHTLFSAIQGEGHTFSRIFNGDFCDVIFHFSLTD